MNDVNSDPLKLDQASTTQGIVLMLAAVLPVMAVVSLVPVLPLLLQEFADVEGSEFLVPIAITIPALCVAIFSPLAGWLSDRVGRKNLLLVAFIVYAVIGVVPYFLSELKHIIASRVLLGMAEATIMTVATALIGDYFEGERREKWVAIQVGVASISAIILIAIGGILGETLGSRGPFLLYLLALPIALVSAIVLFEPAVHEDTQSTHLEGFPFSKVLPLVAVTLGVSLLFYTIVVKLGPILMLTAVVTPALIGAAGAAANMGHVGGAIIFGRFKNASGHSLLTAGFALAATGYISLSLSESLYVSVASTVCASLGVGIMLPTLLAWTMGILPPAFRGRGTGIWTGTFFLGQFIAPIVAVALEGALDGLNNVLAIYGALALLAAIVTFIVGRSQAN
ncbi:MAG: MFS transporter [Halioglobus sp.]